MAFTTKLVPYKVFEYSWTSNTPTDYEIDLGGLANTITFIEAPSVCSIKFASDENDAIANVAADTKIEGIPFSKIYITSTDINESISFFAAWVD